MSLRVSPKGGGEGEEARNKSVNQQQMLPEREGGYHGNSRLPVFALIGQSCGSVLLRKSTRSLLSF